MDKPCFDAAIAMLTPHLSDDGSRRALLYDAFYGHDTLLARVDWSGPAQVFTVKLLRLLIDYGQLTPGRPAAAALLETLRAQLGHDQQARIDALMDCIQPPASAQKGDKPMDPVSLTFLLEIGRWAKSELKERWTLRRQQQSADLSDEAAVRAVFEETGAYETAVPALIDQVSAERSPQEVERTLKLIHRKRDAIYRARNAKLADKEEYDAQKLTKSAFEQRRDEHDATIHQMLDEIENDLADLGITVERKPA